MYYEVVSNTYTLHMLLHQKNVFWSAKVKETKRHLEARADIAAT